jgi:DNA-binding transcriptional ArsR family regulator
MGSDRPRSLKVVTEQRSLRRARRRALLGARLEPAALLEQAGLVTDRAEGTRRLYRLHDVGIEAARAYLEQVWGKAAARFTIAAENTE